jgi:phosphate transport system permease protein
MGRPSRRVSEQGGWAVPTARDVGRERAAGRRWTLLRWLGRSFHALTAAVTIGFALLILGLVWLLLSGAWQSIVTFGPAFLTGSTWDPIHNIYGAGPAIVGTLITSAIALLFAVPIALGVAIFLAEMAPPWLRRPLGYAVDLSAAVPSVVYGFWAFIVLVPLMRSTIEPGLASLSGGRFPFASLPVGYDLLTASIVLTIMIIPTIAALSREAMLAVPSVHRESALSLGATRWESTRIGVLRSARGGIAAGVVLGLGRALGETIAVTMVIGNIFILPGTLFSPGATLASWIVDTFSDTTPGIDRSAVVELALLLLVITAAINIVARWMIRRISAHEADDAPTTPRSARWFRRFRTPVGLPAPSVVGGESSTADPPWRVRAAERARARLLRRKAVQGVVLALAVLGVVLALAPFASVIYTAAERGGDLVLRPSFYTSLPPIGCNPHPGGSCQVGGIGPEIQGTLIMLGLGALIAMPGGLLIGIYLAEYGRNRFARAVSFLADVMTGVPTIILGVFVFTLFLYFDHDAALSALSGGVALGVLMLPIAARATEEALRTVPAAVREAALALGFPRHRVTLRVVLGSSRGVLVTGLLLAASRAAGDTATLLLTAGGSSFWFQNLNTETAAMTPFIFDNFGSNYLNLQAAAWGAALVLLAIMLGIGLAARLAVSARTDRNEAG